MGRENKLDNRGNASTQPRNIYSIMILAGTFVFRYLDFFQRKIRTWTKSTTRQIRRPTSSLIVGFVGTFFVLRKARREIAGSLFNLRLKNVVKARVTRDGGGVAKIWKG